MSFDGWLKLLGVVGAIASFLWGIYQWREKSADEVRARQDDSVRSADTRRIEATKPFLDKQLALYSEATKIASQVANEGPSEAGKKARARFWELYWGELALVENKGVERAMVAMGDALNTGAPEATLKAASLEVARACRASLDKSWGINAWTHPDGDAPDPGTKPVAGAADVARDGRR